MTVSVRLPGAAAASPCTPGQLMVSALTEPSGASTWAVRRSSSVPCVVNRVPSESSSATPWCGAFVVRFSTEGSPFSWSAPDSKVWMDPSPSPNRVVFPSWTTTCPAWGAANVRPVSAGADS